MILTLDKSHCPNALTIDSEAFFSSLSVLLRPVLLETLETFTRGEVGRGYLEMEPGKHPSSEAEDGVRKGPYPKSKL